METNFRILQGILINKNIQLSDVEKDCISSKNQEEYFDYLGENFGSPMFTYSLGTLFCLNESSRNIFDTNSGENIFIVKSPVDESNIETQYYFFEYNPGDHGYIRSGVQSWAGEE